MCITTRLLVFYTEDFTTVTMQMFFDTAPKEREGEGGRRGNNKFSLDIKVSYKVVDRLIIFNTDLGVSNENHSSTYTF